MSRPIRVLLLLALVATIGAVWAGTRSGETTAAPRPVPPVEAGSGSARPVLPVVAATPLMPRLGGQGAAGARATRAAPRDAGAAELQSLIEDLSTRSGISVPAVRAYLRGELRAPAGCHLSWTTLAGVGHVESGHGTFGGTGLDDDGLPLDPIIGPALDGHGPVAAIPATSLGTRWHGDPTWEHAVGPLQFLPGTWATWGIDGDGDGVADPHDLDDAAVAAAGYLCAGGRDLLAAGAWKQAVFSYNHELGYVMNVYAAAATYAALAS